MTFRIATASLDHISDVLAVKSTTRSFRRYLSHFTASTSVCDKVSKICFKVTTFYYYLSITYSNNLCPNSVRFDFEIGILQTVFYSLYEKYLHFIFPSLNFYFCKSKTLAVGALAEIHMKITFKNL